MVQATYHQAFVFVLLGMTQLEMFSKAENETWTCQDGWIPFTAKDDIFCVTERPGEITLRASHLDCLTLNASMVSIHSKEKDDFLLGLMRKHHFGSILLGLTVMEDVSYDELLWWRSDGNEKMDYGNFMTPPSFDGTTLCTWKPRSGGSWRVQPCVYYTRYPYFCEKRPECSVGTFGGRCEKECHCHGQLCDPKDLTGSCRFGCERGWMGVGCAKRKERADVTYYCVNSKDHGTYVSIMIDTKGVDYRYIHGLDALGNPAPWCNDTALIIGRPKDFVNIQIFKTKAGQEGLKAGICGGKAVDENTNQWTLVIQERQGILMDNDQSLSISCNFTNADTLTREGNANVKEMTETPVISLQETHEDVKLEVADAFTGQALTQIKTGSPVRLQMRFGLHEGSLVKGVVPYNCEALSGDGEQKQPLLNKFGCRESDLVSPFHKTNDSHVIQTDWFPVFGFEGSLVVQLQCSFTFCFVGCRTGCDDFGQNLNLTTRHRRVGRDTHHSHRDVHHSVIRRIEIIPVAADGEPNINLPATKPVVTTVPEDKERDTESETETPSLLQWANYNWFFVLFTAIILVLVLIVHIISMWTVHSSVKSIRREMKSMFYQNELLRNSH